MAQHKPKLLNLSPDDGSVLVSEWNASWEAQTSNHSGDSRPSYAVKGMIWIDTGVTNEMVVKLFDGSTDKELARVTASGQVLSGEQAVIWSVIQPGHDFASGTAVRHDGTQWRRAQADDADTYAHAIVRATSGSRITLQTNGLMESLTGLTPGTMYFLSATTAGAIQGTRPATGVAQTCLVAITATTAVIFLSQPINVGGYVKLAPSTNGDATIRPTNNTAFPLRLQRYSAAGAGLLSLLDDTGAQLGGIDRDGYPFGTLATPKVIPVGAMMFWPYMAAPGGWLSANGSAIPDWCPVLRSIWGLNTPNWTGRFPVIADGGFFAINTGGGAYAQPITTNHLPNNVTFSQALRDAPVPAGGSAYVPVNETGYKKTVSDSFRGGGVSLSIIPTFIASMLIIKHDY